MSAPIAGIYAITHVASGRQYIGQSKDIQNRWRIHRNDLARGTHHSRYLQRAWSKDGAEAFTFTILETVDDLAILTPREQHYLDARFAARGSHEFNLYPNARSALGAVRSPETRAKMSETRKGKPWSPQRRAKYRYTEKMAEAAAKRRGKPLSEAHYKALTAVTPARLAHVRKLVQLQTGRPASESRKANIGKALRERAMRLEAEGKLSKNPRSVRDRERRRAKREAKERAALTPTGPLVQLPLFE